MNPKKTTNRDQFAKLVDAMKKNVDIARNMTSKPAESVRGFWVELKNDLDALGPPVKDVGEWKKVWSDFKSAIRKKLAIQNKENRSTGGGPNKKIIFTSIEEEVIDLINLRKCTTGLENCSSYGLQIINLEAEVCEDRPAEQNNPAPAEVIPEARDEPSTVRKKRRLESYSENENFRGQTLKIVENQTAAQCEFNDKIIAVLETLNTNTQQMETTLQKLYREEKYRNSLMEKALQETTRHNKELEKLSMRKIILKEKILESQLQSLN